ncbi:hypothetical protein [Pseudolactococcus raffinolactis]|uniref:hypothetical protein n=1 Tax=Pseudolactococcus raffinolactis TaxID=1366 RepID=UPI002418034E|nr:hypothetical protein [Lactococcus raffinolactis]MDG4961500.1 hypothetical protein [Lactococcus raffinolactis]
MVIMTYDKFYGKKVNIIFNNGHNYTGIINDYTSDDDNDNQGEYWGLAPDDSTDDFIFYPDEVKAIEIIN